MSREIDVAIAEHVMGIDIDGEEEQCLLNNLSYGGPPNYSTDIKAAWEVVEKLRNVFHMVRLIGGGYRVTFSDVVYANNYEDDIYLERNTKWVSEVIAHTAPMAICKAALAAKGIEVSDDSIS